MFLHHRKSRSLPSFGRGLLLKLNNVLRHRRGDTVSVARCEPSLLNDHACLVY